MAENDTIARPYARAVFELARDSGELAVWSKRLGAAAAVADSAPFRKLLSAPAVESATVAGILSEACRRAGGTAGSAMTNLCRLLAENRRLSVLTEISAQFEQLKAEVENIVEVVMTSAQRVNPEQRQRLEKALSARFGREISLRCELDESLMGGARLRANDLVIDGSAVTALGRMSAALIN